MISRNVRNCGRPRVIFRRVRRSAGVQIVLDEEITMLEQVRDFLLQPLARGAAIRLASTVVQAGHACRRLLRGQFLADLGHGPQR